MKILYAHDVPILKTSKEYYSSTFTYDLWGRYLKYDIELIVCSRQIETNDFIDSKYSISSGDHVFFKKIPSLSNPLNRAKSIKEAKNIINNILNEVDGVIVRLPSEIGLLTFKLAKNKQKKILVEMVGCPEDSYRYHGSLIGKVYSPIVKYKNKTALKEADYVVYVTKKYLQDKYPTNGEEIDASNVVLSETISLNAATLKHSHKNKVKIGLIGSLNVKYKGIETAVLAMKKIVDLDNYLFEIVGGGDTSIWLAFIKKHGLEGKIILLGKLNKSDIINWLDTVDIYLQPSLTEGLPRALIEAMSRGCCCIASNVGGIPELLPPEVLINPKDVDKLASKIEKLILNQDYRITCAKKNIVKAKEYLIDEINFKRDLLYGKFFNDLKGDLNVES